MNVYVLMDFENYTLACTSVFGSKARLKTYIHQVYGDLLEVPYINWTDGEVYKRKVECDQGLDPIAIFMTKEVKR
jgi:hypothetical protein